MTNQLAKHYDLIISGGGIVGFTLLNALLKSPSINRCNILLIEQAGKYGVNISNTPKVTSQDDASVGIENKNLVPKFTNRVSSITLSSRHFFKKLGAWKHLEPHAKKVKSIKTWNYNYNHKIQFNPSSHFRYNGRSLVNEDDTLFTVIENKRISEALVKNLTAITEDLSSKPENYIAWNSAIEDIVRRDDGRIEITGKNCETGEEFTTSSTFLIGCDGFESTVRKAADFRYYEHNLDKTAIVGTVEMETRHSEDMNDVAYQRFSAQYDTVVALLPLHERYSSFVISAPTSYAEDLVSSDEESFTEKLNSLLSSSEENSNPLIKGVHQIGNYVLDTVDNLHKRLTSSVSPIPISLDLDFWYNFDDNPPSLNRLVPGSIASYPLHFGTTSPYMVSNLPGSSHHQVALIGDASHRVHPLAGQGLNLGIIDAMILSDELEMSARNGHRVFDNTDLYALDRALNNFQRRRQLYIMSMLASIYTMPGLFNLVPSKTLSLFNSLDCVKDATVTFAN